MAEEIKGLHIFAELADGTLYEVDMPEDEKSMWLGVIGKFYDCNFRLSPVGVKNVPLLYNKKKKDVKETDANHVD